MPQAQELPNTPQADTDANRPSEWAMQEAAGLWTRPQHSDKVMDSEFALTIAHALDAARASCTAEDGENKALIAYRTEIESLLKRIDQKLMHQDQLIREQRGRLDVFETMKALFESGRRESGLVGMEESLSWLIRQTLEHGTPYPAARSTGGSNGQTR